MRVPVAQDRLLLDAQRQGVDSRISADALGAGSAQGLASFARDLNSLGDDLWTIDGQIAEAEASEMDMRLAERIRTTLLDPEQGFLTTARGRAAGERFEPTRAALIQSAEELAGQLRNPRAQAAYREAAARRLDQATERATTHVAEETERWRTAAFDARLSQTAEDILAARTDPTLRTAAFNTQEAIIREQAKRQGLDPDATEVALAQARSTAAMNAIRAEAAVNPVSAMALREELGGLLQASDAAELDNALRSVTLQQQGRDLADQIIARGGTIRDYLAAVDDIEDAALRAETRAAVLQTYNDLAVQYEPIIGQAQLNIVEGRGMFAGISEDDQAFLRQYFPSEVAQLRESQRIFVERRATGGGGGGPVRANSDVALALENAADFNPEVLQRLFLSPTLDVRRQAAAQVFPGMAPELLDSIAVNPALVIGNNITASELGAALQAAEQIATGERNPVQDFIADAMSVADEQIEMLGLEDEEAARARRAIRAQVQYEYDAAQANGGRMTPNRAREIAREAFEDRKNLVVDRGFLSLGIGGGRRTETVRGYTLYVPFSDIPAEDVTAVRAQITRQGLTASPDAIERAYNAQRNHFGQ